MPISVPTIDHGVSPVGPAPVLGNLSIMVGPCPALVIVRLVFPLPGAGTGPLTARGTPLSVTTPPDCARSIPNGKGGWGIEAGQLLTEVIEKRALRSSGAARAPIELMRTAESPVPDHCSVPLADTVTGDPFTMPRKVTSVCTGLLPRWRTAVTVPMTRAPPGVVVLTCMVTVSV